MISIDQKFAKEIFPKRLQDSNKGDFGKVFCITGSNNYVGAGILSAVSALKVGAGYSVLCTEKNALKSTKQICPDLIYKTHKKFDINTVIEHIESLKPQAVVLGCGIGLNDNTIPFVKELVKYLTDVKIPTVLDADALNCIAELQEYNLGENFILTPHPKELSRLLCVSVTEILPEKEFYLRQAQEKYAATVVLKGHNTLIATKQNLYINTTGSSALAKAGTGDVLAGMIGGFLAQKADTEKAACLAVYLHGLAADIYVQQYSEYSMLASDLFDYIPLAIKSTLS